MRRGTVVAKVVVAGAVIGLSCGGPAFVTAAGATPVSGTVDSVGWWTSRPTAMAQPNGGFEVASGPDGTAQSVAALNVRVDIATMKTLQITLTEATSVGSQLGHLRVCTAAPGWAPANPGALADAPKIDCQATPVDLAHTSAGTWVGNIAALIPNGGTASLGIVPVSDSPAPVGTGLLVDVTGVSISGQGELVDRTVTPAPGTDPNPSFNFDSSSGGYNDTPIINLDPGTITNPGNAFEIPDSTATTVPGLAGQKDLTSTLKPRSGPARPWIRLAWLTPLSAAIGVGVVFARRFLEGRGVSFQ